MAKSWDNKIGVATVYAQLGEHATGADLVAGLAAWRYARDEAPRLWLMGTLGKAFGRKDGRALHFHTHADQLLRLAGKERPEPGYELFALADRLGWATANRDDFLDTAAWANAVIGRRNVGRVTIQQADALFLWLGGEPYDGRLINSDEAGKQSRESLRAARETCGLNLADWAFALGYRHQSRDRARSQAHDMESGQKSITPQVARLAEMFRRHGVPPEFLNSDF